MQVAKILKSAVGMTLISCSMLLTNANAAYTLNVVQSGANVVATGTGSLNVTSLTANGSHGGCTVAPFAALPFICTGTTPSGALDYYPGITGPSSFGPTNSGTVASFGSGQNVGVWADKVMVPQGYVSGAALSSSSTWSSTTLAALGLTVGTYTWTWGSDANADSFTLVISSAAPAVTSATVPTLSEYAMMALASLMAMGGIWTMRKRGKI